jgi:uncharacterized protein DUF4157
LNVRKLPAQPEQTAAPARSPARSPAPEPARSVPAARYLGNAEMQRLAEAGPVEALGPRGPGEALAPELRHALGPLVEFDLNQIRVHSGPEADAAAQALGARAFAVGEHIVRGAQAPPPGHPDERRMLTHEVAHVAHQLHAGAAVRPGVAPAESAAEREAHSWASAATRDPTASVPRLTGAQLNRWGPAWRLGADRIVTRGKEEHIGKLGPYIGPPLGSVSVRTDEEVELGGNRLPNVIALEYRGQFSADSNWLQFVWFELQVTEPAQTRRVSATIPTSSGTKPFTTDPAAPAWSLDMEPNNPTPFYNPGFTSLRDSSSIAMFDAPGGGSVGPLVQSAVAAIPAATNVTFRAHFETYLIQRGRAAYVVRWTASTAFTIAGGRATSPGIGYTVDKSSGPVGAVPDDKLQILWRDRPGPWAIQ